MAWHCHRVSAQVSEELQGVSKASAFVKELNGKRAADGNCPVPPAHHPGNAVSRVHLKPLLSQSPLSTDMHQADGAHL